jgi:hypothetical protein
MWFMCVSRETLNDRAQQNAQKHSGSLERQSLEWIQMLVEEGSRAVITPRIELLSAPRYRSLVRLSRS